jgi:hypothetical protein
MRKIQSTHSISPETSLARPETRDENGGYVVIVFRIVLVLVLLVSVALTYILVLIWGDLN